MKLSIGIVGLPNVGKSTLFNALTKKSVSAENYPFCTIDPSVGIVPVPDERLYKLAEFSQTQKTIPAVVEFVDIAGLVEGASKGEGLGNKFLSHIREVDAILQMVRLFPVKANAGEKEIIHVYGDIDPIRDIKVILMELILADLSTVEKRLAGIGRDAKRGDKDAMKEDAVLQKVRVALEAELPAFSVDCNEDEEKIIKSLQLLTRKKMIFGFNKRQGVENLDVSNKEEFEKLIAYVKELGATYVLLDAKTEEDMKDFADEEKKEMVEALGHDKSGVEKLIQESYKLLGLATYFTTGEKETRAWTVIAGSAAPVAAAAIHTDFQQKFIRAQVIFWSDLLESGSYGKAREKGLVRTEGKEYIVKDGDVIEFLI